MKKIVAFCKLKVLFAAVLCAFGVASQLPSRALAQASYRFACRGGPGAFVHQVSAGVFGGVDSDRLGFYTAFKKAAGAVGAGLAAGECSWFDRPMFPDEPFRLVATGEGTRGIFLKFRFNGAPNLVGEMGQFLGSTNPFMRYVGDLERSDTFVVFCVQSLMPSNKALLISSWGPNGHTCR